MKSPWIVLLAAVTVCAVTSGVMWRAESNRAAALENELADLKAENAKLTADVADAKERAEALESESEQLRAARAVSDARLEPDASPTPAETPAKPKANFFAQMFKDPQMRKMMAAQQAGAIRGLYSDFLKQAHLTPDQSDKFFQLLEDRQSALMDQSANMMSGSGIDMNAATAATNTADAAIKDLLGPDLYSQYQDYEKTLAPRAELQQFNQQLTGEGMPLQDYQNSALIQIMSQESAAMPNFNSSGGARQLASMSDGDISQLSQQIDATNQRIYNRAMSVLTAPQLTAFATYQKNMEAAQVAGIKMAQQMMKGQ
jgi:cell division protein FtsB